MPVEIRELQINVTVNQQDSRQAASPAGTSPAGSKEYDKKNLINQCIEQVMDILSNIKER